MFRNTTKNQIPLHMWLYNNNILYSYLHYTKQACGLMMIHQCDNVNDNFAKMIILTPLKL